MFRLKRRANIRLYKNILLFPRRVHVDQFDIEYQRCVRRYGTARTALAIAILRRNNERALALYLHTHYAFIPAFDDALAAEREDKRLADRRNCRI